MADARITKLVALLSEVVGEGAAVDGEAPIPGDAYVACESCRGPVPLEDAVADGASEDGTVLCGECRAGERAEGAA